MLLAFSASLNMVIAEELKQKDIASISVKPEDFNGANASEKIANALDFLQKCNGGTIVLKDTPLYLINEAIVLPSNTTMIVDGSKIKLSDNVFDNLIRSGNLVIDEEHPYEYATHLLPAENIKVIGLNGAKLEGADNFYEGVNPKTGVKEKWLGDYWGWRNFTILFSYVDGFEISGFDVSKTHSWGIVLTNGCKNGHVNQLNFNTTVKNGDAVSIIQGGSDIVIENITGSTSDDSIILAAFDETRWSNEKYVYPLLPVRYSDYSYGGDIHDITVRNIETAGIHHVMIILPSQPKIYNIYCSNLSDGPNNNGGKRKVVRIYGNGQYGKGFKPGNMYNFYMNDIRSYKCEIALEFMAPVYNAHFNKITQLNPKGKDVQLHPENVGVEVTNIVKGK